MQKSVLITGCSKGLGNALARAYLSAGHFVFPVVRRKESMAEWSQCDVCHPILADVSKDDCEEKIKEALKQRENKLDLLINNAGLPGVDRKSVV